MTADEPSARILIVEDSLGVARALSLGLGLYQDGIFRVETCGSGEEALEWLHKTHFDLLISDLRLPGMDGLTLLERTHLISPTTRSILITAFGSAEVEERAKKLANVYLPKPFLLQDLLHQVERILSEAAPPKPIEQPAAVPETAPLVAPTGRKSVHLTVLACDLDGTLSEGGLVFPAIWNLLRVAKTAGLVLILVTGRTLDNTVASGPFNELCEAIVAENGAVLHFPRRDAVILPFGRVDPKILQQLELLKVPLERGMAIAATVVPHDEAVMRTLRENRWGATIEYNVNSVMLLPGGATKGNGLLYALDELGYSPHNVVACGDGENDRSMFEVAELGAAVANARPSLREVADVVLPLPNIGGVEALVNGLLDGKLPARRPRPNRRLQLGHRISGTPLLIDPYNLVESNLCILGASGSGKSWLAGLLAEELLRQKYQLCIIDPEGDYRGLAASPRTLLLGGSNAILPPVADVLNICEWNNISLVLDLSMYEVEQRLAYMGDFLQGLRGLRSRRGRPHYFLVDEIQSFCPPEGGTLTDLFLEAMSLGGFSLISYRPSQIAPVLFEHIAHLIITRMNLPEELETMGGWLNLCTSGEEVLAQLPTLPRGQAFLCTSGDKDGLASASPSEIIRFRVSARTVPHVRHLHKYLRAPLPEYKRFYFNNMQGGLAGSAANLWEFREQLSRVSLATLQYHLERGDFTRWLAEVLHDDELSRRVNKIAARGLKGEALRQALLEIVAQRYEELETLA